jgi:hypothetical protein
MREFISSAQRCDASHADLIRLWTLCLYMMETLGMPRDSFFATRAFFSDMCRRLWFDPALWNLPSAIRPPVELFAAAFTCMSNVPARVVPAPAIQAVSIVDACAIGFAAISTFRGHDGCLSTSLFQRRWDEPTLRSLNISQSTVSEPEALARVASYVRSSCGVTGAMLLLSDHEPFVSGFGRGWSPNPFYNSRIRRLRRAGVDGLSYTPGATMLADKYSRFVATCLSYADLVSAQLISSDFIGHSVGRSYRIVG